MLRKCCFCIGLRKACVMIAILDFCINMAVLFVNAVFKAHIEQAVAICHCIGCCFLLSGALIKSTVLLMFFLITSLTNCIILTTYCVILLVNEEKYRETIVPCCALYVCLDIYFWVVVYSFYVQVRTPEETVDV